MSKDARDRAAEGILPPDWTELAPLVDLLLDAPREERPALLARLSAGDAARHGMLERLLAECERDLPLIDRPAAERFDQLVADDEVLPLPELVGDRYRTGHEVGRGGMARVYVAHDIKHDRDVAIKVIRSELSATVGRDRFLREIGIAARLRHPNILPLYDSGEANGALYFVMPFEAGPSLSARLARDGPLSITEALSVLRDVARALQYAHAQGVVHRDIKPGNIMLSGGAAVVTDFGIAKALSASQPQTPAPGGPAIDTLGQAGATLGTPAYMPPEQAVGDPATDHRADLYAWGVVAYELLAGRHPFGGHTSPQELMAAHLAETPAPLPESIPRPLAALVMRCLAKSPAQRPASANELLVALEAPPPPNGEQAVSPAVPARRRRRAAYIALAVISLVVPVALAVGAWARRAREGAAPARPPLVAVLPFETVAAADGVLPDSIFADALGDAIAGKLARLQGLRVMDRASVRSVPEAAAHPLEAGRTLRADYVLRATLRWSRGADGAPRVEVSPLLVRVADGTTKWAGKPTVVTPGDPFSAQGALATAVAEALDVAHAPAERARLARPPTTDTAAFAAAERGRRLKGTARTQADRVLVLREFERAYQLDPNFADAFGKAAEMLLLMVRFGAPSTYVDSAAVLARHALALDPGQADAVEALAKLEERRGRVDEGTRLIEQAARAFPSSAPLQLLLAGTLQQDQGDTAGAADAVSRAAALAPRSPENLFFAFYTMLSLRRYDDARELLALERALEPGSLGAANMAADLALALGDTAGVSSAMRTLRAAGQGAQLLHLMRGGDAALQQALAAVTLASLGATTAVDSNKYFRVKSQLHLAHGEGAKARALADSGYQLAASHAAKLPADVSEAQFWWLHVAWFAAARRDRQAAVAALRRSAEGQGPLIEAHPGNQADAHQTCFSAEVYGLLDDADAMLPLLRRCVTMPNGYDLARLGEPAFMRLRADPRVRALSADLATAQARARRTPIRTRG